MDALDTGISEVAATLDQDLREANMEPKRTKDAEVSQPNMTTKTTRGVYNLCKGKNGNHRHDYSHCFGYH